MKKRLLFLLVSLWSCSLFALPTNQYPIALLADLPDVTHFWRNPASASYFTWTSDGTQITLTGYSGPNDVVIPDILDGLPVTGFGIVFKNTGITSIKTGKNIISVDYLAFLSDGALTNVDMPYLVNIGIGGFAGCSNIQTINFPMVVNVGTQAFSNCTSLYSIYLPVVTNIPFGTFTGCHGLTGLSLPSVTVVGNSAFADCPNLVSIVMAQNTPAPATDVFYNSPQVITIYITNPTASGWGATWYGKPVVRLSLYGSNSVITGTTSLQTLNVSGDASVGGTLYVINEVITNVVQVYSNLVVNGIISNGGLKIAQGGLLYSGGNIVLTNNASVVNIGPTITNITPILGVNANTVSPTDLGTFNTAGNTPFDIIGADNKLCQLLLSSYGASQFPKILFASATGTCAAPSNTTSFSLLANLAIEGYGSTGRLSGAGRAFLNVNSYNGGAWTDTNQGYMVSILTGPQTGVNNYTRQRWYDDGGIELGGIGAMAGGSPGAGVTLVNGPMQVSGSISNNGSLIASSGLLYSGGNLVLTNAFDDGSRFHSVWTVDTNKLYIVSPNGLYTNLISTTHQ